MTPVGWLSKVKSCSVSLGVMGAVTKGTAVGVTDGKRGLPGWGRVSEHKVNKGSKPRGAELTAMPELVNFTLVWVFTNPHLYQTGKRPNHFVWVELVLLTLQKKIIPVNEPLVDEILRGVMPLGEHNSRCCKTCNCLSPEMTTGTDRKGKEH